MFPIHQTYSYLFLKELKKQNKKNKNNNFRCSISLRKKKGKKRTFYTSSGSYKNASLTVEAALVFPIFILAFWFMLYGLKITELQAKIQYALNVTAEEINAALKAAQNETLQYTEDPIVSSDVIGRRCGSLVDGLSTSVLEVNGKQLIASSKRNMQTILEEDLYDVPKLAIVKMCLISFNGFSSIADMNPAQTKEFIDEIFGFKLFSEYNSIVQEEKRNIQNNTIKLLALQEDSNKNIESLKRKKHEQQIQLESNIDIKNLNDKRNKLIEEGKNIKSVYDSIYNEFKIKEKKHAKLKQEIVQNV